MLAFGRMTWVVTSLNSTLPATKWSRWAGPATNNIATEFTIVFWRKLAQVSSLSWYLTILVAWKLMSSSLLKSQDSTSPDGKHQAPNTTRLWRWAEPPPKIQRWLIFIRMWLVDLFYWMRCWTMELNGQLSNLITLKRNCTLLTDQQVKVLALQLISLKRTWTVCTTSTSRAPTVALISTRTTIGPTIPKLKALTYQPSQRNWKLVAISIDGSAYHKTNTKFMLSIQVDGLCSLIYKLEVTLQALLPATLLLVSPTMAATGKDCVTTLSMDTSITLLRAGNSSSNDFDYYKIK